MAVKTPLKSKTLEKTLVKKDKVKKTTHKTNLSHQREITPIKEVKAKITAVVGPSAQDYHQAIGRRKSATAIVRLYPKDNRGVILVNNKPLAEYFPHFELQKLVNEVLESANILGRYTISIKTIGGGKKGQAAAARHGLARLIIQLDELMKPVLRAAGFLTRDPRVK